MRLTTGTQKPPCSTTSIFSNLAEFRSKSRPNTRHMVHQPNEGIQFLQRKTYFILMLELRTYLTLLWYHEKSYVNSTMGSI